MASSTKPEVHNISQRRHSRTEPRPYATLTKNLGGVRPCGFPVIRTDNRHTHRNTLQRSNNIHRRARLNSQTTECRLILAISSRPATNCKQLSAIDYTESTVSSPIGLKRHSHYARQRALTLWEGFCVNARQRASTRVDAVRKCIFIIC